MDSNAPVPITRSPNPNNPMEYCSVIPPHQQVASSSSAPISVMVPVGILKRSGKSADPNNYAQYQRNSIEWATVFSSNLNRLENTAQGEKCDVQ